MDDELKSSLDDIFAKHEQTKSARAQAKANAANNERLFLDDFKTKCSTIIDPVMRQVGEYVGKKGYEYRINFQEQKSPANGIGRTAPAQISLTFFTDDKRRPAEQYPGLIISADTHGKQVSLYESFTNQSGPAGSYSLDEITKEFVQAKLVAMVSRVYT